MHPQERVQLVLSLIRRGLNDCEVSRTTGIPRSTVREWRIGRVRRPELRAAGCFICRREQPMLPSRSYAYLLGQYLGDGFIARTKKGVFVLRVFSFSGYPNIVAECAGAMSRVMPASKVSVIPVPGVRLMIVSSSSKHWPCLFPQHGPGRKHERRIRLDAWQQSIVEHHPEAFLRGLVHSDGCRYMNRVKHYEYPSYGFANMSGDISRLFSNACDQLAIKWRRSSAKNLAITRRDSVAEMDTFIGPKG